jgi:hypothetical protein
MARKMKKSTEPSLWASVWDEVAFQGEKRTVTLRVFTVAASRKEAVAIMKDGIMGLPRCEGSHTEPRTVWRVSSARTPDAKKGYAMYLMRVDGFLFIAPYDRMTPNDVGELVERLVSW